MKKFLIPLLFSINLGTAGFAQEASVESSTYNLMLKGLLKRDVPEVDATQAYQLREQVIFIDTRSRAEYEVSHIRDAIWVGYDDFEVSRMHGIDKNAKIIAYCSVGYRSEQITRQLREMGYYDVSNLYGGIFEWVNLEKTVYKVAKLPTDKIHAYNKAWGVWLKKGDKVYLPRPN